MNDKKTVEESKTEQTYLIMHRHINGYGRLFGGQLMSWIDEMAGVVSKRHARTEVTTATVDTLNFKGGAHLNEMVVLVGRITYVGTTSMEVRIDTYIESLDGRRRMINRAYVVMVAIDADGRPLQVPGLELQTEAERAEWESGERRYRLRKKRRVEGY